MDTVGARIFELRKKLGLTQGEFASRLGLTGVTVSTTESDKTPLTKANMLLICHVYNVREEWLRDGIGEMLDMSGLRDDEERILVSSFRRLSPTARKMILEHIQVLIRHEEEIRQEAQRAADPTAELPGLEAPSADEQPPPASPSMAALLFGQ
ncbi:MAG: helix-turn-helix domain-containing protein [Spirochaetota bacterium]|jgi:transcriptional regulator with XRE-family HTH domain|nr:helix-turn-helix domain-containing protein [Spirochaetota bacterium]